MVTSSPCCQLSSLTAHGDGAVPESLTGDFAEPGTTGRSIASRIRALGLPTDHRVEPLASWRDSPRAG